MYIGVDLGTSSVKCILVKTDGTVVKTESESYDVLMPKPSWREQHPEDWFNQTLEALKKLVIGYEDDIKGISFSGQMHGLVILDEKDCVIRPAILWNDQRTVEEVNYLNETIGVDQLMQFNGNIALTGLTAPKLLWMRKHEPELFDQICKIMLPKDYLVYRLSGVFASDVTDMSGTLFFDPKTRTYSHELLHILNINKRMLPKVYESSDIIGTLLPEIKETLKLKHDISVVIGGGDQAVGAIGTGIVKNGTCGISLGTSGVIFVATDEFIIDKTSYLQSYAHANGKYHLMAVMLSAAGSIKWWNENILESNDYLGFYKRIDQSNIHENLFFLPYLNGERAPINDPLAKGVLFGLSAHHVKKDIDRAILEGVTFAIRDSFDLLKSLGIHISEVKITGGGAKNKIFAQLIADVFNTKVIRVNAEEGPAFGAAILAMVGSKVFSSVEMACETLVKNIDSFDANLENTQYYNKKYQIFKKLYPQIRNLFGEIK